MLGHIHAFCNGITAERPHFCRITIVITSVTLNAKRKLEKLFNHNVPRVVVYLKILYYVVYRNLEIVVIVAIVVEVVVVLVEIPAYDVAKSNFSQ